MDSPSDWLAEEQWDRNAWLGCAVADETRQLQSVSPWLQATYAERRRWPARDEGQRQ